MDNLFGREMPNFTVDELGDNIPPAGTSKINVYFVNDGKVWEFDSWFCTLGQRDRVLDLVASKPRIDFGARRDLLADLFGGGA